MSLAPEQAAAALDGLGDGWSAPDGDGSTEVPGVGPLETVGLGSTELVGDGSGLGVTLGATLGVTLLVGGDDGVPSPQPATTSRPAARIMEIRTVPAVRGRMGVTRQA